MVSYIYVVASSPIGPCKIGLSKSPDRRVKELQTAHPEPLSIHYREQVEESKVRLLEQVIHKTIRHLRSSGEWFNITVEEAIAEVKHAMIRHGDDPANGLRYRL